jgi:hypothetical protein
MKGGGVPNDKSIKDNDIARTRIGSLPKTKKVVIKAKPSPDSLYWDIPSSRFLEYAKTYQNINYRRKTLYIFRDYISGLVLYTKTTEKDDKAHIKQPFKKLIQMYGKPIAVIGNG